MACKVSHAPHPQEAGQGEESVLLYLGGLPYARHSYEYNERITAGQSLGQKNTVFGIWMGYTFLDPVTSLAGGFYSIWHNCFNTWQLRRKEKE